MRLYPILDRWTLRPIVTVKAYSLGQALEIATKQRVSLAAANLSDRALTQSSLVDADLRAANLQSANLAGTNLCGADLRGANLRGACLDHCLLDSADLRGADLRGASFRSAGLHNANLVSADLRDTDFTLSHFGSTMCDWQWGVIAAEMLRRDKGYWRLGIPLVLDLECIDYVRPFGWLRLLFARPEALEWATETLNKVVMPEDNAPRLFRHIISNH